MMVSMSARESWISRSWAPDVRVGICGWVSVWSPIGSPAATTRRQKSGSRRIAAAIGKKVAGTPAPTSSARIRRQFSGLAPSSKVSAMFGLVRDPWLTTTALPAARVLGPRKPAIGSSRTMMMAAARRSITRVSPFSGDPSVADPTTRLPGLSPARRSCQDGAFPVRRAPRSAGSRRHRDSPSPPGSGRRA